jgi:hypothetical protein
MPNLSGQVDDPCQSKINYYYLLICIFLFFITYIARVSKIEPSYHCCAECGEIGTLLFLSDIITFKFAFNQMHFNLQIINLFFLIRLNFFL